MLRTAVSSLGTVWAAGVVGCTSTGETARDTTTARSTSWPAAPPPRAPEGGGDLRSPAPAGSGVEAELRCDLTEDNIEGPFFKAGAPRRVVLADAYTEGTHLSLSGRVLDRRCRPVRGARIEVWHADHHGAYDNAGFAFRATLEADDDGVYGLETILPGRYLNGARYRPAHVHAKIVAPGFRPLTTQLYFAGDPYNEGDPFIRESLVMSLRETAQGKAASYDIVLG